MKGLRAIAWVAILLALSAAPALADPWSPRFIVQVNVYDSTCGVVVQNTHTGRWQDGNPEPPWTPWYACPWGWGHDMVAFLDSDRDTFEVKVWSNVWHGYSTAVRLTPAQLDGSTLRLRFTVPGKQVQSVPRLTEGEK